MLSTIRESTLLALERSHVVQDTRKMIDEERKELRHGVLLKIECARRDSNRSEADLVAKAAPLEKKLATLRAEISKLEADLAPLAQTRLATMSVSDLAIASFRKKLRLDARDDVEKLQNAIEVTRTEISHNLGGRRHELLSAGVNNDQVVTALALLLEAYREADRIAAEEIDIQAALENVRQGLARSGIRLVGANL